MATFIGKDYEAILWTGIKAYCPICKRTFTGWYCPSCGLPKKNSKYALYKEYMDSLHNCDKYHFRPEFSQFEDFKLCDKCYTTNPFNAKYCRNCKNKLSSKGVTKDAHGWVDLGLSVLWATETIKDKFRWMSCKAHSQYPIYELETIDRNYRGEGKDAATEIWGHKWRTPTKDEFEELFTKCQWERFIDPDSKKYGLKATGPNGSSIILPLDSNHRIDLWTSTEYTAKFDGKAAYALDFHNEIKIEKTRTAKQNKELEFATARSKRESDRLSEDIRRTLSRVNYNFKEEWNKEEEFKAKEREISRQEYMVLSAMGDDRKEREINEKMDKEKLDNLWLSTPVKFSFNEDIISDNKPKFSVKGIYHPILPVADKKWKNNL